MLWCFRCRGTRPARAHHCSTCKCCIEQMDHHCPWIQRCVGKGNRAHFIQFLLVAAFGLSIYLVDVARFIYRIFVLNYRKFDSKIGLNFFQGERIMIFTIIMLVVGSPFTLFLNVLLYDTLKSASKNITGIEDLNDDPKMQTFYKKSDWRDNIREQIKEDPKLRLFQGKWWLFRFYFNLRK